METPRQTTIQRETYWWTSRFLTVLAGVSLLTNFILVIAVMGLFPLERVQPFYLSSDQVSDKTIYVQRQLPQQMEQGQVGYFLAKTFITKYVLLREQITQDFRYMHSLWGRDGELKYLSSDDVYKNFRRSESYQNGLSNRKRKTRFVKLKEPVYNAETGKWIIEGDVIDQWDDGRSQDQQQIKISLTAEFSALQRKMPYKDRLKNPLGFVITNYEYQREPRY